MSAHRIEWRHDHDVVVARFYCDESLDAWADCRVICDEGCEEWPPPDPGNQTHEVLGDSGHPLGKHAMRRTDYCNYVTWMEGGGSAEELHLGGDEPVRDGAVEFEWNGDGYDWRYGEAAS